MMKKLLLSTQMLFVSICGFAHDCEVNGIYYNLNTTDYTASVTYKPTSDGDYSGIVRIPKEIEYDGTTYSVTSIGNSAFYYCDYLTELTIPSSVTSIDDEAFWFCSGLERIIVEEGNLYYDSRENCNAIIRIADNELVVGCKNTFIPTSVTSIGNYAFFGCSGLTEMTIPNSVTSIGESAFHLCSGMTSLTIGTSVTSIGRDAFAACFVLTELTIPNSVTSIGSGAFFECLMLPSIISLNTTPPHIGDEESAFLPITEQSAFLPRTEQNVPLHVPAGCKEIYQRTKYWKNFKNIKDDASTGIESINADKQVKNMIYTLDGVKLNTTNLSDLHTGIYVVNGKKYVVK